MARSPILLVAQLPHLHDTLHALRCTTFVTVKEIEGGSIVVDQSWCWPVRIKVKRSPNSSQSDISAGMCTWHVPIRKRLHASSWMQSNSMYHAWCKLFCCKACHVVHLFGVSCCAFLIFLCNLCFCTLWLHFECVASLMI